MLKNLLVLCLLPLASMAFADSYWDHNGSVMRLAADGNKRYFYYEHPTVKMQRAGVTRGTLLFDGVKSGDKYYGTARVFSKDCQNSLPYNVSGNVYDGPKVVVTGTRASYSAGCRPNGKVKKDVLTFTYMYTD